MVGLAGGIGSGKSVVASRLAELGAVIIDSDRVAREVVAPGTDGLAEVVATFGTRVLDPHGGLDRAALGEIVFADAAARARLEEIIHPRVRARSAELAAQAPRDAIVVNDVPLLVEVGLAPTYHLVVVVHAAEATRIERLVRDRGMTPEHALRRIRAQVDDARRAAAADVLLRNDADLPALYAAVDVLWRERLVPYERNVRDRRISRRPATVPSGPDPDWPAQYARLAARIRHAVRPAELRIDHVGPTAVPGMLAYDVLDLQLTVDSLAQADALAERLAAAGFPRCPAGAAAEREHGSADPGRPARLWLRPAGSPAWRAALLLRDYLRADPEHRVPAGATRARDEGSGGGSPCGSADGGPAWSRVEEWAAATGWRP
mgnify:CR=1 FL=1